MRLVLSSGLCIAAMLSVLPSCSREAPPAKRSSVQARRMAVRLVPQMGHSGPVKAVAFSQDARFVVTGSTDKTARLWDAVTGAELQAFEGNYFAVTSVAISPDNRYVLTGGMDKSARLWDATTGKMITAYTEHPGQVLAVAFSPDGRFVLTGCSDGVARYWDRERTELVQVFRGHTKEMWCVAFSPDGRQVVTGSQDGNAKLWDVVKGAEIRTFSGSWAVSSVAFSPDGQRILTAAIDGTTRLWEAATGVTLRIFKGSPDWPSSAALSPDGNFVLTSSWTTGVTLWNVATGAVVRRLTGHAAKVESVTFSPDGRQVLTGNSDNTARLWDAATGAAIRSFAGVTSPLRVATISPSGRFILVGLEDGTSRLWDLSTGGATHTLTGHKGAILSAAFSVDSRLVLTGGLDDTARLWDVATGAEIRTLAESGPVESVAFSPDGQLALTASWQPPAKLWDLATGKKLRFFPGQDAGRVQSVAFSPDGRLVLTSSGTTWTLWDAATGTELRGNSRHSKQVTTAAFSPDARLLLTGSLDGTTKLWDSATGEEIRDLSDQFPALRDPVSCAAFSPDGRLVLTGSRLGTPMLWDVATGTEVRRFWEQWGHVTSVAFFPDGRSALACGWGESAAYLWDTATGTEIGRLITMRDGGWVVVSSDGLFDGSPGAWEKLVWRFAGGNDFAPVEAFFNEFYCPGLLADIAAGRRPAAPRNIADVDRRQPKLSLSRLAGAAMQGDDAPPSRTAMIRITATEAPPDSTHATGSGLRDMRLFRNGSLVKVWHDDVPLNRQGCAVIETLVTLVAGENRLTAYAFNRDNVKSANAELMVAGDRRLQRKGTAFLVAVGVDVYSDPSYNLRYAAADASDLSLELKRQISNLGSYKGVERVLLTNREATKHNILFALHRLAGRGLDTTPVGIPEYLTRLPATQPEDVVIVTFAGHGLASGQRFVMLPHDLGARDHTGKMDRAGLESMLANGVSDQDLEAAFEPIDAKRIVLVIDACNSGQALEAEEIRRGPMNSKGLAQLAYEKGIYVLAAAQGYQAAIEVTRLGHGLLTYTLVEEGLKRAEADKLRPDGKVDVREWFDYALERVPELQEEEMQAAAGRGVTVVFTPGDEQVSDVRQRSVQRPRAFYRRELEAIPLVVGKR